jgi:hypothetical protein
MIDAVKEALREAVSPRDYLAALSMARDSAIPMVAARAVMGEHPPSWPHETWEWGEDERLKAAACIRWWQTARARLAYQEADIMLEVSRAAQEDKR